MEKALKHLGLALIILGALLLILPMLVSAMADLVDYNWYTVGNIALIIIGLILHILMNKHLPN